MTRFPSVSAMLAEAVRAKITPAAVVEVGRESGPLWRDAFGQLTYDADAAPAREDTIFDLASLTKVIATSSLLMRAIDRERLQLDDPVAGFLSDWRGPDRSRVTIRDLAAHCSGLTAYLPFYKDHSGRAEFERAICTMALEYPPRTKAVYSDLGYILLGFILEDVLAGTLDDLVAELAASIRAEPLGFNPHPSLRPRIAPTEIDPWRGRLVVGEVHDENCWALGGAAGHAGLFGTAAAVGAFARTTLSTFTRDTPLGGPSAMRLFATRTADVPGSSRALGWDTMLPTSSCGTRLSARAIGHTGFTGTSLWIDPELDLYIVLLTNRVHPTRENNRLKEVRAGMVDEIVVEIEKGER